MRHLQRVALALFAIGTFTVTAAPTRAGAAAPSTCHFASATPGGSSGAALACTFVPGTGGISLTWSGVSMVGAAPGGAWTIWWSDLSTLGAAGSQSFTFAPATGARTYCEPIDEAHAGDTFQVWIELDQGATGWNGAASAGGAPCPDPIFNVPTQYPSDDCTSGSIYSGASGGVYARLATEQADAQHLWICYRADTGNSLTVVGGKVVVTGAVGTPTVDGNYTYCTGAGGVTLFQGQLGDPKDPTTYVPLLVAEATDASGAVHLCLEAGTSVQLHIATLPTAVPPVVTGYYDSRSPHAPMVPVDTAGPSATCESTGTTVLASNVSGSEVWLGTASANGSVAACARIQGGGGGGVGGELTVGQPAQATTQAGIAPSCTTVVVEIVTPGPLLVERSAAGSNPSSLCVAAAGVAQSVVVTSAGGTPSWQPDPGTP